MAAVHLPNNNLTFIHIPKNGGSSVVRWFKDTNLVQERIQGHPNLEMMRTQWTIDRTFAIVRNPWARIVSSYFYLQQYKFYWENNNIQSIEDFPSWDKFVSNMDYSLNSWNSVGTNQYEWLSGEESLILRAESLNDDFKVVQDMLDIDVPLPYINKSIHDDYQSYFNTEQIKHVANVFAKDIDMFKYTFQ